MSDNKVLALKYRPRRFEDLVGQTTVSQTLSLALDSNRLSHAYLFSGLRGSGKTSTARIMAKALLCEQGPTSKPCETCENCKSANAARHLDIIEMDAASNRGIDDIKDLIEHTKYKPSSARFKVFIIDEVHMLTTQAFNALLKTLEEPPGFVKFILATTDPLKLPATILSRTQHFRFNKIAPTDVLHHLSHILNEENIDFDTTALEIITRSGQGSLRDTLTLLDQAIIFSKGKVTVPSVVDMLGLIEPKLMDDLFDIILKKEDIRDIVKKLENYEISQVCDEMTIYLKQKMLDKDAKFDLLLFDRFFRILSDAKHLLSLNCDGGFVLILTLSKMIEATNLKTIDEIIEEVEQIEAKPEVKTVQERIQNKIEVEPRTEIEEKPEEKVEEKVEEATFEPQKEKALQEPKEEIIKHKIKNDLTPFDEEFEALEDDIQVEETIENRIIPDDISSENLIEETVDIAEEQISQTVQEPDLQEEIVSEPVDENIEKYKILTDKVYDRDHDLGEMFEKNFLYKSFENKTLKISSYAQGEERKFLFNNFGVIKTFIYEVFGYDIELDFIKEQASIRGR